LVDIRDFRVFRSHFCMYRLSQHILSLTPFLTGRFADGLRVLRNFRNVRNVRNRFIILSSFLRIAHIDALRKWRRESWETFGQNPAHGLETGAIEFFENIGAGLSFLFHFQCAMLPLLSLAKF